MLRLYSPIIFFNHEIILNITTFLLSMSSHRKIIGRLAEKFVNGKMLSNIIIITRMFSVKKK